MRNRDAVFPPGEPDSKIVERLFFVQQVSLALVVQIAAVVLFTRLFAPLSHFVPASLTQVSFPFALAVLFSALSLYFSDSKRSRRMVHLGWFFASCTALISLSLVVTPMYVFSTGRESLSHIAHVASNQTHESFIQNAVFVLLVPILLLIRSSRPFVSQLADVMTACLCLLVLILSSELLFGTFPILGPPISGLISPIALACLLLLTLVVVFRRAEFGIFSIFLGHGVGGKLARVLSPVLLVLPIVREALRTRLLNAQLLPPHRASGILTSVGTAFAFSLLLYLVRRINLMEEEIQDLSLRDGLTGLYNFRGFHLLAEQLLRLTRRTNKQFVVLFIDLDNLKEVNDKLGHEAGSGFLIEAANLLLATFRETDVIGRIGGDEFVVAGQFSTPAISAAIQRLNEATSERNAETHRPPPLSFSIGHAIDGEKSSESLKQLVRKADAAMYEAKRHKKSRSGQSTDYLPRS